LAAALLAPIVGVRQQSRIGRVGINLLASDSSTKATGAVATHGLRHNEERILTLFLAGKWIEVGMEFG
jgi:hypothetical protein